MYGFENPPSDPLDVNRGLCQASWKGPEEMVVVVKRSKLSWDRWSEFPAVGGSSPQRTSRVCARHRTCCPIGGLSGAGRLIRRPAQVERSRAGIESGIADQEITPERHSCCTSPENPSVIGSHPDTDLEGAKWGLNAVNGRRGE